MSKNKELQSLRNQMFNAAVTLLDGSVETDNYGQIVIYTGLMYDESEKNVVPWKEPNEKDSQ